MSFKKGEERVLNLFYEEVLHSNYDKLKEYMETGWNINESIPIGGGKALPPIMFAIMKNNYDLIEFLLQYHAKLDLPRHHALLVALKYGDADMVQYIIDKGAKLKVKDHNGCDAFVYAYRRGVQYIEILERAGLDVHSKGGKALRYSISTELTDTFYYLLKQGANVNYIDPEDRFTPLHSAILYGNFECVKLLVENGADISIDTGFGRPYIYAMLTKQHTIANYLEELESRTYQCI